MKIEKYDLAELRRLVIANSSTIPTWPAYKAQGLTYRRWLWDLFHATVPHDFSKYLYLYLNDDNITTALESILGKEPTETEIKNGRKKLAEASEMLLGRRQ